MSHEQSDGAGAESDAGFHPCEPEEEEVDGLREIGRLAVWSVSSTKPGNGVNCLRDDRADTFWQ